MANRTADEDTSRLREHLVQLLDGGQAHAKPDTVLKGIPAEIRGRVPKGLPYSPWRLIEHMRIAQWDILDFSRNPNYAERTWPDEYWPSGDGPESEAAWRRSLKGFRDDLEAMKSLVADPGTDLFAPIPWGNGQTILREALLTADHNSHHLGQLIVVRRLLGAWH